MLVDELAHGLDRRQAFLRAWRIEALRPDDRFLSCVAMNALAEPPAPDVAGKFSWPGIDHEA